MPEKVQVEVGNCFDSLTIHYSQDLSALNKSLNIKSK